MFHEPAPAAAQRKTAMTSVYSRTRELAERTSSGTRVRLLWRQGTRQVWVEVREPEMDQALAIPVSAERALEAFHHPYAYASPHQDPTGRIARRFKSAGGAQACERET